MKVFAFLALILFSANAQAEGGRFLPRGEDNPRIVANVFRAPVGEVQILEGRSGEMSAMLRTPTGGLAMLQSVGGASRCDEWLKNGATNSDPAHVSCVLHFRKDSDGSEVTVDTRQLEGSTLFGLVKSTLKGKHGAF